MKKDIHGVPHIRHKLNMLYPGVVMVSVSAATAGVGVILTILHLSAAAKIAFVLAAALFLVLLFLVAIELRQDRILNEAAIRENAWREKEAANHPWRKPQ